MLIRPTSTPPAKPLTFESKEEAAEYSRFVAKHSPDAETVKVYAEALKSYDFMEAPGTITNEEFGRLWDAVNGSGPNPRNVPLETRLKLRMQRDQAAYALQQASSHGSSRQDPSRFVFESWDDHNELMAKLWKFAQDAAAVEALRDSLELVSFGERGTIPREGMAAIRELINARKPYFTEEIRTAAPKAAAKAQALYQMRRGL